jgi:hypothetical protein
MQRSKRFLVLPKSKDNSKRELADILKKAGFASAKLEVELIGDSPVIWITSGEEKKVHDVLRKAGVKSFSSDMTIIKLPETPGELAKIARVLTSLRIEVRDAHLILKSHGYAIYGVTTDKPAETRRIVDNFTSSTTDKEGKD